MMDTPMPSPKGDTENEFNRRLEEEIAKAGGQWQDEFPDAIGRVLYDLPGNKDNTFTVILPLENLHRVPFRSLVRITSRGAIAAEDRRQYLGIVIQGPIIEPDGLRPDSPLIITSAVRGAMFMPNAHGRILVSIIGEERDGSVPIPARFRPLPGSPVFVLDSQETAAWLKTQGDVRLGLALGYDDMPVGMTTARKDVFPRHMAVLGTTGAGKSNTVSTLIGNLSRNDVAVVVFDVEGEYTHLMQPNDNPDLLRLLEMRGQMPVGLEQMHLYHLIGRETSHPNYADRTLFSLEFSRLSPYAVIEILGLNEAQQERFLRAYDLAKHVLASLHIYPANRAEEQEWLDLDELETGYPRLTLHIMYDVVRLCAQYVANSADDYPFASPLFEEQYEDVFAIARGQLRNLPGSPASWRRVQGTLGRLLRLKIFDTGAASLPDFEQMTQPGRVSIVDLSGTDSRQVNNLVISQLLSGLWRQQEENYRLISQGRSLRKTAIVIEEAHEFLSAARISQMEVLLDQVTRIARRGRKRWLSLVFVSQTPEDVPDQILGLVNNFVLHKITNANVVKRLRRTVGGLDEGLWERLPDLEPGIAIVRTGNLVRPLLVSVDPSRSKLLLVD